MKKSTLLFSALMATPLVAIASKTQSQKPNIIFILADDLGYGDLSGLNPGSKIQTPNIDRMMQEGVCFTDAHSPSAVSTPTRYGILTGRYCWRSSLKSDVLFGYDKPFMTENQSTIPSVLRQMNYKTAGIGKWHLGWVWANVDAGADQVDFTKPITQGPTTRGFDYFYGISGSLDMAPYVYVENDQVTALPDRETEDSGLKFWRKGPTGSDFDHEDCLPNFTRRVQQYIRKNAHGNQPFFLYYALPAPHTPILPVKAFQGKSGLTPYGDFVLMVDWMVGEIIRTVKEAGIDKETLIVFTSDNGCSPGADIQNLQARGHEPSYIYRGQKADLFDGGHRIPCVVRWPGKVQSYTVTQPVCLTDFFATFAEIADYKMKPSDGVDSYSLWPLLKTKGSKVKVRETIVHHSINGEFSIRKGNWKLLISPSSGGWSFPLPNDKKTLEYLPSIQLYNLAVDPSEKVNVYAHYPQVVSELKALMASCIRQGRSTPGEKQENDPCGKIWKQIDWMKGL
ncbi:MAG: arylsulfatase [Bacteroidia bacterium]|nr:arylsulfatase [Bacteroidia bacterium]